MKHIYSIIVSALAACSLWACSEDDWSNTSAPLTPEQQELIGKAVQIDPYIQEFFAPTRVGEPSSNHNGGFNTGDIMYLYRQYAKGNNWEYRVEPGSIYKFTAKYNGATGLFEKNTWKPFVGKQFTITDPGFNGGEPYTSKKITAADTITWENGETVRFRAWVLSSLCNTLTSSDPTKMGTINYPDYMVSDWVTVSGPSHNIPMSMRHLGCRLAFAPINGDRFIANEISITFDKDDYMRKDNADTNEHDAADIQTEEEATRRAAEVEKAYKQMCWPAGIDLDDMSLLTCARNSENQKIKSGTKTQVEIATDVMRPTFRARWDSHLYMITIPYDMSSEHKGEPITLPPYTRFKVYIRDINHGDAAQNPQEKESDYHIFALDDAYIRDGNGNTTNVKAFPNGLKLMPGYSYRFYVGYRYERLYVTACDNFSWNDQDLADSQSIDNTTTPALSGNYDWFKNAISEAINKSSTQSVDYNPVFHISNTSELQEFINLVNGDFKYDEAFKMAVHYNQDSKVKEKKWYRSDGSGITLNPDGTRDTTWVSIEEAESEGYIFYEHYHPFNAGIPAYSETDYLHAPYSFYDEDVQRAFVVNLDNDLDFGDSSLEGIGSVTDPFAGYFNGNGHVLKDINVTGGVLFKYAQYGSIINLRVDTPHPFSISGDIIEERILGCSINAPSTSPTLAANATGPCYFVGCFHYGNSNNATQNDYPLVGSGDDYTMYGCMQAAAGITKGALGGLSTPYNFLATQGEFTDLDSIGWDNFIANYYDTELSPSACAVTLKGGSKYTEKYNRRQYIRGVPTHVMCAKNDLLIDIKTNWKTLTPNQRIEYYGIAPWKAMNFAILNYNATVASDYFKCNMHYEPSSNSGYNHNYPVLWYTDSAHPFNDTMYEDFFDTLN